MSILTMTDSDWKDSSPQYVYHSTNSENISSIIENGIRYNNAPNPDSEIIIEMLDELGFDDPFPFLREK